MNADPRTKIRVDVPPARAKPRRFFAVKATFGGVILLFTALGLWKAYELVVAWLGWYESRRGLVNAVLVLIALAIFVGALVFVVNTFRARREPDLPLFPADERPRAEERATALMPSDGDAPLDPLFDADHRNTKSASGERTRAARSNESKPNRTVPRDER